MEVKKKIYYAHSMQIYNSQIEHDDIKMLELMGFEVVNPNNIENERLYAERNSDFQVFLDLVDSCDILAFRGILNKITAGVASEIERAQITGKPIIELPYITQDRILSWNETVTYFRPLNVKN